MVCVSSDTLDCVRNANCTVGAQSPAILHLTNDPSLGKTLLLKLFGGEGTCLLGAIDNSKLGCEFRI